MTTKTATGEAPGIVALEAGWECAGLQAGSVEHPDQLAGAGAHWLPAAVPGTVAGALRAAGRRPHTGDLDGLDWWFRCRFPGVQGPQFLELGGLATIADVWLNGTHVLRSENMHRAHAVAVGPLEQENELVVRCAALAPVLAQRRPRPRWKTYLVDHQQLRWVRTSLLGRIGGWAVVPPVVGVWRPVRLRAADDAVPRAVSLRAICDTGGGGVVEARFELPGGAGTPCQSWQLQVGGVTAPLSVRESRGGVVAEGAVTLPQVERWWPHTHGPQPLYEVFAGVDGRAHRLGRVGFRTVAAERTGGGFQVRVNGEPVFCRGACWFPPDPVTLNAPPEAEAHLLGLARAAGMNMLRIPGTTVYESPRFFDRCDELGIMVWQDCMFAFMDPPSEEAFADEVRAEVSETLTALGGRPCVAVVCGNQEVDEIAAMFGLEQERRATPLFDKTIADIVASVLPGVPYVPSNPTGGDVPFRMDTGVSQYFGVGGYLRPPEDARRAGVRFAAECLALATPPEPQTVDEHCGGAWRAGHDPAWKEGVHHDAGRSWDLEDVRDHYVDQLFGVDPLEERHRDAERALDLGRAANAWLMEAVFTEWRRPSSSCDGALVLSFADLRPGAGWGVVDAAGRPKAPWYALARVLQPLALLAVDEGLNGLALHVTNDRPEPWVGQLVVELVSPIGRVSERGEVTVEVAPRGTWSAGAEEILGGWRDVTYAYRFAAPAVDAVVATLRSADGEHAAQVVHLPLGQRRPVEADLGLRGIVRKEANGSFSVEVTTTRLAQWVSLRVPGFIPGDSWFHLPPGGERRVQLWPDPAAGPGAGVPERGTLHALNGAWPVPIAVADR